MLLSEQYLDLLADLEGVVIFVVEPDDEGILRLKHVPAHVEEVTGAPLNLIVGKTPEELYPGVISDIEQIKKLSNEWQACIQERKSRTFIEHLNFTKNNADTWWKSTLNPRYNERGELERMIYCAVEITDQILTEQKLKQSEQLFRSVVNDQTEMIVRWLPGGIRTFVNKAYCDTYGVTKEEVLGTSFYDLIDPGEIKRVKERLNKLSPKNPVSTAFHEIKMPDGSRGYQEWTDRAFFDISGNLQGYQSTGRDITEKIMNQQLVLEQVFENIENERARIATDLHDSLGQSLTAALMAISAMDVQYPQNATLKRELTEILEEALSESKSIAYNLLPASLRDFGLADSIEDLLGHMNSLFGIEVNFVSNLGESRLPEMLEKHLYRIVQEAIQNCIKHAGASKIKVKLDQQADKIVLCVCDNGVGFSRDSGGLEDGVPLRSLRTRLQMLNGEFSMSSDKGWKTIMSFSIPVNA